MHVINCERSESVNFPLHMYLSNRGHLETKALLEQVEIEIETTRGASHPKKFEVRALPLRQEVKALGLRMQP